MVLFTWLKEMLIMFDIWSSSKDANLIRTDYRPFYINQISSYVVYVSFVWIFALFLITQGSCAWFTSLFLASSCVCVS